MIDRPQLSLCLTHHDETTALVQWHDGTNNIHTVCCCGSSAQQEKGNGKQEMSVCVWGKEENRKNHNQKGEIDKKKQTKKNDKLKILKK